MLHGLKRKVTNSIMNIPGWRTNRKIIVIESDDWGSVRMPNLKTFEKLEKEGYNPGIDPYLKYDSLASETDLEKLFEVLKSVKDINGHHAVITANSVMTNPDFELIKKSNYSKYYYEPFTETLKKYPNHNNSFKLWKEGMSDGIFHPQFHGREHLNVERWMQGLQSDDKDLRTAFDNKMISISSIPSAMKFDYLESWDYFSEEGKANLTQIVTEGLDIFERLFGYRSLSFIANCYIWDEEIERVLNNLGVRYIQGIPFQFMPRLDGEKHTLKKKYHYIGQQNSQNQYYLVRNVHFEPSVSFKNNSVNEALQKIGTAFFFNKPAIISTHRLNFIGEIDMENRDSNLKLFAELLTEIVKKWPNVEFMTSDDLGEAMILK
jgi:hypothetical protein